MEQQRIVRENEEAKKEAMKARIKESGTTEESLTEMSTENLNETKNIVEPSEEAETEIETEPTKDNVQGKAEESSKSSDEDDGGDLQNKEEETVVVASSNEKLLNDLCSILDEEVANKAYDILINQIGFTNVEYIGKNPVGDSNYDFSSDKYNFMMTASDDVYRVFQSRGGFVFYEDGEVKNSISDIANKTIDHNDRPAYYIMAQSIVEGGLKNPKSATFPSIVLRPEEIAMSKKDDVVAVQSYVDAQNSFGATIRSKRLVEFRVIDLDTYSYEPMYVNIDGEVLYGEFIELN